MATTFNNYLSCNRILASGNLCDCEYFLIIVLLVKAKEMSVKKFEFLLRPIFAIFCRNYIAAF